MSPPPPPSSPGSRAPPELWSMELPFALLPPKKRWLWLWRTTSDEATDPVPAVPLPPPVLLPQIHATPAGPGAAAATNPPLATPAAHEADAVVSSPAAGQKRSSPLPPLAGDLHEPNAAPPPSADGKPSTPPPCKRGRKVVRRVRKVVKKIVPKGTTSSSAARKKTIVAAGAEEAAPATGAAGASQLQEVADEEPDSGEFVPDKTSAGAEEAAPATGAAGASQLQAVADEEPEPGEFVPDKTSAGADCNNADAARQLLLGEQEEAAGKEAAVDVAGEPEAAEQKLVSSKQGAEQRAEMARQNRMREVFVGALHTDAKEEDVRAALAEAGEITDVRMIMDAETKTKNRGYCFVQYREPAQARKAIEELGSVKICGKSCRIQALEVNSKAKLAQRDPFEDYTQIHYGETGPFPIMGGNSYYMSHNPHARNGSNAYAMETSSYGAVPHAISGYSPVFHHGSIMYLPDSNYYGPADPWDGILMRQSGSRRPGQPHGRRN